MNTVQEKRPLPVKILAIIGFSAVVLFLGWLVLMLITKGSTTFSSLATITKNIAEYRPLGTLTLTTQKSVVNVHEPIVVEWNNVGNDGTYTIAYSCAHDLLLHTIDSDKMSPPLICDQTYAIPKDIHSLSLVVSQSSAQSTDISLTVSFVQDDGGEVVSGKTTVTVKNVEESGMQSNISSTTTPSVPDDTRTLSKENIRAGTSTPSSVRDVTPQQHTKPQTPSHTVPYSTKSNGQSTNPQEYIDLVLHTLAIGVLQNGTLIQTKKYSNDTLNAIRIDIENIGTKTSGAWHFTTTLPDDTVYTSPTQIPLKPNEHAEFTLTFGVDARSEKTIATLSIVFTQNDVNNANNYSSVNVAVD